MTEVRVARPAELASCLEVRRQVFVVEQDVWVDEEVDGKDPECTHFVAINGAKTVGTARLRVTESGEARAERVAVLTQMRGQGLGHALMNLLEAEAARQGHLRIVLHAQVDVIAFYEARGYEVFGEEFLDARIRHRAMAKGLEQETGNQLNATSPQPSRSS